MVGAVVILISLKCGKESKKVCTGIKQYGNTHICTTRLVVLQYL